MYKASLLSNSSDLTNKSLLTIKVEEMLKLLSTTVWIKLDLKLEREQRVETLEAKVINNKRNHLNHQDQQLIKM